MDSVVSGEIHLAAITHKPTRDALRQAAEMAAQGDPVWIVGRGGRRIGAIVSVERCERSMSVLSNPCGTLDLDGPEWGAAKASGLLIDGDQQN